MSLHPTVAYRAFCEVFLQHQAEQREIIDWCVVPALEKMVADLEGGSNPYKGVLQALLLSLKDG
jgi:hypothetical protein